MISILTIADSCSVWLGVKASALHMLDHRVTAIPCISIPVCWAEFRAAKIQCDGPFRKCTQNIQPGNRRWPWPGAASSSRLETADQLLHNNNSSLRLRTLTAGQDLVLKLLSVLR